MWACVSGRALEQGLCLRSPASPRLVSRCLRTEGRRACSGSRAAAARPNAPERPPLPLSRRSDWLRRRVSLGKTASHWSWPRVRSRGPVTRNVGGVARQGLSGCTARDAGRPPNAPSLDSPSWGGVCFIPSDCKMGMVISLC